MDRLLEWLRTPYGPLVPWGALLIALFAILTMEREWGLSAAETTRSTLESEWVQARQALAYHKEAKRAALDLRHVWEALPAERDFAPLALGVTEEAKRDHVTLPALSYKTEPTSVANTTKGVLQGSMSGRYEDLRRFLYDLETAEELLFIEDLDLAGSPSQANQTLTFNVKIVTYLRGDAAGGAAAGSAAGS